MAEPDTHIVRNYFGNPVYAGGLEDCTTQASMLNERFNCDTFTVEEK